MRLASLALALAATSTAGCPETPPSSPTPSEPAAAAPAEEPAPVPCDPGLDAGLLGHVGLERMVKEVAPGERVPLRVGIYWSPDVPFEPVRACVKWSVAERDMGTVDEAAGVLRVLPGAKGKLHLRGEVTGSAAPLEEELLVIGEDVAPIVGYWREEARLDCGTRKWLTPERPIVLLDVRAAGTLSMTWTAADFYRDYEADFRWNPDTKRLTLRVTDGKYAPADARKEGTARIERKDLILEEIWLGGTRYAGEVPACGHRFVRR
jgi:hypothetical protein